jgi:hypothetical protein
MINHPYLDDLRSSIRAKNDSLTGKRIKWVKRNPYFYNQLLKTLRFIIRPGSRVLHIRCGTGYILNRLDPSYGVGVEDSALQIEEAKRNFPHLTFYDQNAEGLDLNEKFDYILITSPEDIVDLKAVFDSVKKCCDESTRLIVINYNILWYPVVRLAEKLKLRLPQRLHNWVSPGDINNLMVHSGYESFSHKGFIIIPFNIPILSYVVNRFIARLPFFKHFTFMRATVARPLPERKEYSVSIVIPCRNEEGNIEDAVRRIPNLGTHTEIIFGDDKSTDGTVAKIKEMIDKHPEKDIKLVHSPGICKAMNVWTCFDHATCDVLMILDADLTVIPEELPYFYEAIASGRGEFINGSRMMYPMHEEAMRFFNIVGNKFFSLAFSYILDVSIKDTLCGTKVVTRKNFEHIKKLRNSWGINDRWGDYELIFGASKSQLKLIDLPVNYTERIYGTTKMTNRIKNGLIMLKMCWAALLKIKFY